MKDVITIASRDLDWPEELASSDPEALGVRIYRRREDGLGKVQIISM